MKDDCHPTTHPLKKRMLAIWIVTAFLTGFALAFPSITHVPAQVALTVVPALGIAALFTIMEVALSPIRRLGPARNAERSIQEAVSLSETCQDIRGAFRQYHPSGGELHDALVEATHRCCRITNIAGDTTDVVVVETVELIRNRLPSILSAYQETTRVADPKELWAAVDRMAEAVVMVGDQAEAARKRLLAHATDGLETEVRYLSARTGRDEQGFSSILSAVN